MADAISPQALSELIGLIYDCALDPSRWEQTLPNVMDALESHIVTLHLSDLRTIVFSLTRQLEWIGRTHSARHPSLLPSSRSWTAGRGADNTGSRTDSCTTCADSRS
jgi:hypothetical protein